MQNITPKELIETTSKVSYTLIDVRTPEEYHLEHISGAINMPLDRFQDHIEELKKHKNIVLYCNSGNSSSQFYKRAEQAGITGMLNLQGGISGCQLCIKIKQKGALPMMQQVQIAAGSLVLLGIILARVLHQYSWHEYFIGISAFVGAGLIFAGSTGWCGLAKLLAKLPWNRITAHKKSTEIHGKNLLIKQFEDKNLAHYSYIAISNGEAVVVDPERDVQKYIDYALQHNARIVGVLNTHPHADFASGHLELHKKTGATIYVGAKVGAEYPHTALAGGEKISCGSATITTYFTPGHSPDSISYLIKDETGIQHGFFTGDWVFLGDVGRADLRENVGNIKAKQAELAGMMYDTTRAILPTLDGNLSILPAHGAGTSCGKGLSKMNIDTLANQRKYNPMLQDMSRENFIAELTSDQPAIPAYFTNSVLLNKRGNIDYASALHTIERLQTLDTLYKVIDTRPAQLALAYPLVTWAISIPHDGNAFVAMLGALVKPSEKIVLIVENNADVHKILHGVISIGYETNIAGIYVVEDATISPNIVHKHDIDEHTGDYTILDVRSASAFNDNPVYSDAINIPIEQLSDRISELDKAKTYIPYCGGTYKSHIAYSVLKAAGIQVKKQA